jgi:hypothetical protein
MSITANAFSSIISAVQSATPPSANSAEGAMQRVVRGSNPTEVEDKYFEAFREYWQKATADSDLARRVHQYLSLQSVVGTANAPYARIEAEVRLNKPQALKAAFARFFESVEGELLGALVADPDKGARIWQAVAQQNLSILETTEEARKFGRLATGTLLKALAKRAAAAVARSNRMSEAELTRIVDVQVRAIVLENQGIFVDGAVAGVAAWSMPIADPDNLAGQLSLSNDVVGGISSVITTVASFEVIAAGTVTVLNLTGIGLVVVGVGFAVASYLESVRAAEEAFKLAKLEAAIKKDTVTAFLSIRDGITATKEMLAMICTVDALNAGIDLRSPERDPLRRFIWQRMFPRVVTPDSVAVMTLVTREMDQRLNPKLVGT